MSTEAPIWLPQAAKQKEITGLQRPALCSKAGACCSGISPEMVFPRQNYHLFYLCASLGVLLPPFLHPEPQFVLFYLCSTLELLSEAPAKRSMGRGIASSASSHSLPDPGAGARTSPAPPQGWGKGDGQKHIKGIEFRSC